ncbi:MAG: bifunctional nuclease domain-containing protein [Bacteroidota bacterium]
MSKIKLNVLGISYSQTQSGAYALVLTEEQGERRIPIIVGGFEAQAIAIQLEGLKPPRPLTHDLFLKFANAFKIDLIEVEIYKLEEGVFYSKLICDNGMNRVTIDARTSDAIALALRFQCPIYSNEDIMSRAGIILDFEKESKVKKASSHGKSFSIDIESKERTTEELREFKLEELEGMLQEAITREDYEQASRIRDEINRRESM